MLRQRTKANSQVKPCAVHDESEFRSFPLHFLTNCHSLILDVLRHNRPQPPLANQHSRTAVCSLHMTLPPRGGALLDGSLKSAKLGNFSPTCRQRRACRKQGAFKTFAMETRNRQAEQQARRKSRKKGELPESGFFAQADPKGDRQTWSVGPATTQLPKLT